jgi:electron transfer flavoprotein alpha subunit
MTATSKREKNMKIAVVVLNRNDDTLSRINTLLAAADTFAAAQDQIEVWMLGNGHSKTLEDFKQISCNRLVWVRGNSLGQYLPEIYLDVLVKIFNDRFPDMLLFNGDLSGNELAVRMCFRIGGSCVTEARGIARIEESVRVTKGVYSLNLSAEFQLTKKPYAISVAKGAFRAEPQHYGERQCTMEYADVITHTDTGWIFDVSIEPEMQLESLEKARLIVAGGRGVGSRQGMEQLERLASLLRGEVGASRPAALSGWLDINRMIGQSGKITAPDICIAVATSGAAPFVAGVQASKLLIAINKDSDAPIFKACDVGIIEEYQGLVEELISILENCSS